MVFMEEGKELFLLGFSYRVRHLMRKPLYSFYCKCIIINPYHTFCSIGHEQKSPHLKFLCSDVGQKELKLNWLSNFNIPMSLFHQWIPGAKMATVPNECN